MIKTEDKYKVIGDNLGEYSIVTHDNVLVAIEIENRALADLIVNELNDLDYESKQYKLFIKQLADNQGKIILLDGRGYDIKNILEE